MIRLKRFWSRRQPKPARKSVEQILGGFTQALVELGELAKHNDERKEANRKESEALFLEMQLLSAENDRLHAEAMHALEVSRRISALIS